MKSPTLEYGRLADHLTDKGLIDLQTIEHVLEQCDSNGSLMSEVLVNDGLVSDWEVSRMCAELFHLPYLPIDCYPPEVAAKEGLDPEYLRKYGLVPLDRFGSLLTVAMPGLVPSEVLNGLRGMGELTVLPVVGSVQGNRAWLDEHLQQASTEPALEGPDAILPDDEGSWANLFDEAEEAVQLDLKEIPDE